MTANAARPVRFGLNLPFANSVTEIVDNARRASDVGFDVVLLGDHLGHQAPLAPLVAIADAVPLVRVGNLVLNAPLFTASITLDRKEFGVDYRLPLGLGDFIIGPTVTVGLDIVAAKNI